MAVILAGVVAGALLWPDDEVTLSGDLTWTAAPERPAAHLMAVTATDDGYLAASPVIGGGIDFWTSKHGYTWEYAGRESDTFRPTEIVDGLIYGPAGFVATVEDRAPESFMMPGSTSVFTSDDGVIWSRTELAAGLPDHPSPYMLEQTYIEDVISGPDGYLAHGRSGTVGDLEKIMIDYGLDPAAEFHGVGIEEGPGGYELRVDAGDDFRIIPIEDLGLTEEDALRDISGVPLDVYMWWSDDGVTWDPIDVAETPFGGTGSLLITATEDAFYAFGFGTDEPHMGDEAMRPPSHMAYRSEDGRTWTELGVSGLPAPTWIYDVVVYEGIFYASGADDLAPGVWTSPDFTAWTRLAEAALIDLGRPGVTFGLEPLAAGEAGLVATGMAIGEPEEGFEEPDVAISKDGYTATWGDMGITLADESTGAVIAEIDWETFESETVNIVEDELGSLMFVDAATGDELVTLDRELINATFEDAFAGAGPTQTSVVRYSIDGQTWTLDDASALFGDGAHVITAAVGRDSVVALVITDVEAWLMYAFGEAELQDVPIPEVWVGDPRA
jgi:hypothetical protein